MRKAKFKESQLGKTRCPACPVQVINSRVEGGWILGNLSAGGEGGGAYRDLPQGHICCVSFGDGCIHPQPPTNEITTLLKRS